MNKVPEAVCIDSCYAPCVMCEQHPRAAYELDILVKFRVVKIEIFIGSASS